MAVKGGRLDDAARAGWLYYVAGNTQDQIAAKLGVSRQSAQRLVSLAVAEGLVKVRIDHPIANCLELASRLRKAFDLKVAEVVPTDPEADSSTLGVAEAAAAEIERWLRRPEPLVMAIGTGRTLKAAVEQLSRIECQQHRIASLTGNIAPDGSAAVFNVIFTMADRVKARFFPMPLAVIASTPEEKRMLHAQAMIRPVLDLAAEADVVFVGIGDLGPEAPLYLDGFITEDQRQSLTGAGAVGEICGWAFDAKGHFVDVPPNDRVASAEIPSPDKATVIAMAKGERKLAGIHAALVGKIVNGLITDEATAEALLSF
ncbi:Transcriptional regulator LsrR [Hartmannibacter diazotrophicus]|uniref:Transcriptional regulator LsrR n=1 Tax=Hartmannibacter diazotrophicus TaxID=1482074 RepID=A0A2C9DCQ6_9HYPH|nr:sugar-binding transcriptional regulator [Hartmannibacter diazotrophicus]SON58104.1 Transcriptional regulator LsrR [Hartmannibacter diazotrophicus]